MCDAMRGWDKVVACMVALAGRTESKKSPGRRKVVPYTNSEVLQ